MGPRPWILASVKYLLPPETLWNYLTGFSLRIGLGSRGPGLNYKICGDSGWLNV